jgi:peptidoglycan-associated lipoprotein
MTAGPPKLLVSAFGNACPKVFCFLDPFYLFVTFNSKFGWKEENMQKKLWICISLLVIIPGLLFTTSCAKKIVKSEPTAEEGTMGAVEETAAGDAGLAAQDEAARKLEMQAEEDLKQAQMAEQAAREEEEKRAEIAAAQMFMNEDVYFYFDSSALEDVAKDLLYQKAKWLRMDPDASVIIEGHCDERGTNAYNIALGDRRAVSTKVFLLDLGIDANQLSTISYGEERPVDTGKNEEVWAQNRRAHFMIE